jgi:hypothetical protein
MQVRAFERALIRERTRLGMRPSSGAAPDVRGEYGSTRERSPGEEKRRSAVIDRNQVHEGMEVRSSDGRKLGRVLACREGSFVVEKGFFFATDYVVRYDDVTAISADGIWLSRPQEGLPHAEHAFAREGGLGESFSLGVAAGPDTSPRELAEDEEEEVLRGRVRGDEDEAGSKYNLGPPSYGDEGGGGLL